MAAPYVIDNLETTSRGLRYGGEYIGSNNSRFKLIAREEFYNHKFDFNND